ncbi:MAG: hypothetical protein V3V08_12940 [Nannocystaceae bacterium]
MNKNNHEGQGDPRRMDVSEWAQAPTEVTPKAGPHADFVDVVQRAHAHDPRRVPQNMIEEAAVLLTDKVSEINTTHRMSIPLAIFVASARRRVEYMAAQRMLAQLPPVPRRRAPPLRIAATLAMAAVTLILIGVAHDPAQAWSRLLTGGSHQAQQTVDLAATRESAKAMGTEQVRAQRPGSAVRAGALQEVDLAQPRAQLQAQAQTNTETGLLAGPDTARGNDRHPPQRIAHRKPGRSLAHSPDAREPRASNRVPHKQTRSERLRDLDAKAQALWREGELEAAERSFRRVIKLAGRGAIADLAYGDLFTLARQRGAPGDESKLWRQYIRRFPHGRFSDDVRAGLCRRANPSSAATCWRMYLDQHPGGSHAVEATRSLSDMQRPPATDDGGVRP